MWLALDTATDRASLALGLPGTVLAEESLFGARRQAAELLPMLDRCLARAGASLAALEGIVLADGPGSFTGLRVGASVAKALVHHRGLALWTAPSLLGLAAASGDDGALVLALSDALRGELFAGAWRVFPARVDTVLSPGVFAPDELRARLPGPGRVVGPAAAQLGATPTWPRAAALLSLVGRAGALTRVTDPAAWEPSYGRPAEAQAKWERAHGRPLPDPARPER
jgi:tRNA threonylcarbamoyl adenosine modification protein YeaZ